MVSNNKRKIITFLGIGIVALSTGYRELDRYINKNLSSIIEEKYHAPEWITLLPGKPDRILDIYIEKMKSMYETEPRIIKEDGFIRAILFSEEHAPHRKEDVYMGIVEFLLEKGNKNDAMFYAKQFEYISTDNKLVRKVEDSELDGCSPKEKKHNSN